MKLTALSTGIARLSEIRSKFASAIRTGYEHRALPCSMCSDPGICCRDEHFVNVRISKLEADAIRGRLAELGPSKEAEVLGRAAEAIEKYGLAAAGSLESKTFACPLFEPGSGCLVHDSAKPLPCIAHACYDSPKDLPPSELLEAGEMAVAELNRRVYGRITPPLPLPVAITRQRKP